MLPQADLDHLRARALEHSISVEAGMTCVCIPRFPLPAGFDRSEVDLLLRLSAGYPDVPPDMWWFTPSVRRLDGTEIPATQSQERHLGRDWQRWSRHLAPGQWRSGVDSLESYLAIVRREVAAAAPRVPA
jgi:hypothetical protein